VPRIIHPQRTESLQPTKYPFADSATLTNGEQFLPENAFSALSLYPIGAKEGLYLRSVVVTAANLTLCVGDSTGKQVATAVFDPWQPQDNLRFIDQYGRPAGYVASSRAKLANLYFWGSGEHKFTRKQTEFAASCCIPTPEPGVRGFTLPDGSVVAGDVWLLAEQGVVFTPVVGPNGATTIQVNVVGDPLYKRSQCGAQFDTSQRYIRKIRISQGGNTFDCLPDDHGGVRISTANQDTTRPVLRVSQTAEGIEVHAAGIPLSE